MPLWWHRWCLRKIHSSVKVASAATKNFASIGGAASASLTTASYPYHRRIILRRSRRPCRVLSVTLFVLLPIKTGVHRLSGYVRENSLFSLGPLWKCLLWQPTGEDLKSQASSTSNYCFVRRFKSSAIVRRHVTNGSNACFLFSLWPAADEHDSAVGRRYAQRHAHGLSFRHGRWAALRRQVV